MSVASLIKGIIRGSKDGGVERSAAINARGDQYVAQGLPPYAEITRQGGGYSAMLTGAIVGLVVRPSTLAAFTLWNGEGTGGKSYVIDRLFTHNLVSTNALSFYSIWACIHPAGMAKPTSDVLPSATNFTGHSGKKYNGMGVLDSAATVIDNGWYPWATSTEVATATVLPGSHISVDVMGRLIVPPQGAISLTVVCSLTSTVTFTTGCSWWEVQLDLE